MQTGPTLGELEASKAFETSLEQRPACPTSEIGREVFRPARDGNGGARTMDAGKITLVRQSLGREIYDVPWSLLELADLAGVDLRAAFERKAQRNEGREW